MIDDADVFSRASRGELEAKLRSFEDQRVDARLITSSLPQLNRIQQKSALAVAAHLVHADRKITAEETDLLDQLTRQMTLPDNEARMVVEAIAALNRDMRDS